MGRVETNGLWPGTAALFAFPRGLGSFPEFTITPSPHPEHSAKGKHLYKAPEDLARSEMEGGGGVSVSLCPVPTLLCVLTQRPLSPCDSMDCM